MGNYLNYHVDTELILSNNKDLLVLVKPNTDEFSKFLKIAGEECTGSPNEPPLFYKTSRFQTTYTIIKLKEGAINKTITFNFRSKYKRMKSGKKKQVYIHQTVPVEVKLVDPVLRIVVPEKIRSDCNDISAKAKLHNMRTEWYTTGTEASIELALMESDQDDILFVESHGETKTEKRPAIGYKRRVTDIYIQQSIFRLCNNRPIVVFLAGCATMRLKVFFMNNGCQLFCGYKEEAYAGSCHKSCLRILSLLFDGKDLDDAYRIAKDTGGSDWQRDFGAERDGTNSNIQLWGEKSVRLLDLIDCED